MPPHPSVPPTRRRNAFPAFFPSSSSRRLSLSSGRGRRRRSGTRVTRRHSTHYSVPFARGTAGRHVSRTRCALARLERRIIARPSAPAKIFVYDSVRSADQSIARADGHLYGDPRLEFSRILRNMKRLVLIDTGYVNIYRSSTTIERASEDAQRQEAKRHSADLHRFSIFLPRRFNAVSARHAHCHRESPIIEKLPDNSRAERYVIISHARNRAHRHPPQITNARSRA